MRVIALALISHAILVSVAARAAESGEGGGALIRVHSAGLDAVTRHPEAGTLKKIVALGATQNLLKGVYRQLGASVPTWFGGVRLEDPSQRMAWEKYIETLARTETILEVREAGDGSLDWGLAVRMSPEAAVGMGHELGKLMTAAGGTGELKGDTGSWVREGSPGRTVRFAAVGGWMIAGCGTTVVGELTERATGGRLGGGIPESMAMAGRADLRRLAGRLGWGETPPGPVAQWPVVDWTYEARRGGLRGEASLAYAQPHGLKLETWQIPRHLIRDPLVGFSAVQGADTWLSRAGFAQGLEVKEWPKQLFLWSVIAQPWPWLQYAAAPVADPADFVSRAASGPLFANLTNWLSATLPVTQWVTNEPVRMEFRGLPFLAPYLEANTKDSVGLVVAGLFPLGIPPNPPPEELFSQVTGRTNLLVYDWETTGRMVVLTNVSTRLESRVVTNRVGRLAQLSDLSQFVKMVGFDVTRNRANRPKGPVQIPGLSWIEAAIPHLGDTVTEVTVTGNSQLSVVRQSQTGFSAWELIGLLRWVDNPGFPGWTRVGGSPVPAP